MLRAEAITPVVVVPGIAEPELVEHRFLNPTVKNFVHCSAGLAAPSYRRMSPRMKAFLLAGPALSSTQDDVRDDYYAQMVP